MTILVAAQVPLLRVAPQAAIVVMGISILVLAAVPVMLARAALASR